MRLFLNNSITPLKRTCGFNLNYYLNMENKKTVYFEFQKSRKKAENDY